MVFAPDGSGSHRLDRSESWHAGFCREDRTVQVSVTIDTTVAPPELGAALRGLIQQVGNAGPSAHVQTRGDPLQTHRSFSRRRRRVNITCDPCPWGCARKWSSIPAQPPHFFLRHSLGFLQPRFLTLRAEVRRVLVVPEDALALLLRQRLFQGRPYLAVHGVMPMASRLVFESLFVRMERPSAERQDTVHPTSQSSWTAGVDVGSAKSTRVQMSPIRDKCSIGRLA